MRKRQYLLWIYDLYQSNCLLFFYRFSFVCHQLVSWNNFRPLFFFEGTVLHITNVLFVEWGDLQKRYFSETFLRRCYLCVSDVLSDPDNLAQFKGLQFTTGMLKQISTVLLAICIYFSITQGRVFLTVSQCCFYTKLIVCWLNMK